MASRLRFPGADSNHHCMNAIRTQIPLNLGWLAPVLIALVAGCSTFRRPGPVVDRSEDARIVSDVQARIAEEPALNARQIRVDVDGRVVTLYGAVQGMGEWQCALRNAGLVAGVNSVVDYLVIERGPREITCRAPRTGS